jgi:hypothetical protein
MVPPSLPAAVGFRRQYRCNLGEEGVSLGTYNSTTLLPLCNLWTLPERYISCGFIYALQGQPLQQRIRLPPPRELYGLRARIQSVEVTERPVAARPWHARLRRLDSV